MWFHSLVLCGVFVYCSSLAEIGPNNFTHKLSTLSLLIFWILPEIYFFFCIYSICIGQALKGKLCFLIAFSVLSLLIAAVYCSQSISIVMANGFLPVTAFENIEHSNLVKGTRKYAVALVVLLSWIIMVGVNIWAVLKKQWVVTRNRVYFLVCVMGISIFLQNTFFILPNFRINELAIGRATPVVDFVLKVFDFTIGNKAITALPVSERVLREMGLYYNAASDYPFYQEDIPYGILPFTSAQDTLKGPPNVIILFLEGVSARLVEPYSHRFPSITPALKELSEKSSVVHNYYSHTAATFKGIYGQLTSSYPLRPGGEHALIGNNCYHRSVAGILKKRGYETSFFTPHPERNSLTTVLHQLEIDTVYSAEKTNTILLNSTADLIDGTDLRDRDIFRGLTSLLRAKEKLQHPSPFFIGLYNIETHVSFDTADDDLKYGNGNNRVLNTIHNLDAHLGLFFEYFQSSPWVKNTILIITADHAHFPEPPMIEIAGEDYQRYFVGKIPLLIHAPFLGLPKEIDAEGRTSLDFAPTLMNILGIHGEANSFLGRSLFLPSAVKNMSFASIGKKVYIIREGQIYHPDEIPNDLIDLFLDIRNYVFTHYQYEMIDRIFPR